ncbi:hypothetical protein [Gemmatimonas sp.]|uniref:hypothetical protein n=1 Tax=Gemmatimonas sp. TaxID=1962908 RepID=UPI0025BBF21C|nr:hypothetical protein [Gemmatimonas sp.]MCA2985723.1 hypothetical protein [Gemmatimonas sp.]
MTGLSWKSALLIVAIGTAACRDRDTINIGGPKSIQGDSLYAVVRGGWLLETGDAPSPQMAASITCERYSSRCTESSARIGKTPTGRILFADGTVWEVVRWDATGIEATMDAPCGRWSLLIDFAKQQAKKSLTAISITGICADYATWKPSSFLLVNGGPDQGWQPDS